jgi:hypothetical protein
MLIEFNDDENRHHCFQMAGVFLILVIFTMIALRDREPKYYYHNRYDYINNPHVMPPYSHII